MKPIRLELEGFTSFRERVKLDFTALDLFAITGPTGAGKTSLIDGMIYALYGRTPRLGAGVSELISHGAPRLEVLLEFGAGRQRYRIFRSLKRGGGAVVQLEGDDGVSNKAAEVRERVQQILGLDFDAFTKSVVLPQGEFDRFLRGKPEERRQILRDLLHLDVYEEMGRRANERSKACRTERVVIEQQLAAIEAEATEEKRASLEKDLEKRREEQAEAAAQLAVVKAAEPLAQELREQRRRRQVAEQDLRQAQGKLEQAQSAASAATRAIEQQQQHLAELDRRIAAAGYDERRHLELTRLQPLARQREQLETVLARLQKQQETTVAEMASLVHRAEEAERDAGQAVEAERVAERTRQENHNKWQQARNRHGPADSLRAAAEEGKRLPDLVRHKAEVEKQLEHLAERRQASLKSVQALEKEQRDAQAALKKAEAALEHVRQLRSADDLRRHLTKGKACPVCEQIVGKVPKPGRHGEIDEAQTQVDDQRRVLDQCRAALVQKKAELENLPQQIQSLERSLGPLNESISAIEKKMDGRSEADLRKLAQLLTRLESELTSAAEALDSARKLATAARQKEQTEQHRLDLARQQQATLDREIGEKAVESKRLDEELSEFPNLATLEKQLSAQQSAKEVREICRQQRNLADEQCRTAEQHRSAAQAQAAALAEQVDTGRRTVESCQARIADLQERLGQLGVAEEGLEVRRSEVEQAVAQGNARITMEEAQLERVVSQIAQAQLLRSQVDNLRSRETLYSELGRMLAANQFVKFVLEQALRRLAAAGTARLLQLSSGRYSFLAQEDDFHVVDHENADQQRSVHTLSGGESFLASLALALALAEGLAEFATDRENLRLDSLFLDEGFSTLDPETLDVVVQGIENLADQTRLIGVISHVSELAERLPARIRVHKSPGGSRVEID